MTDADQPAPAFIVGAVYEKDGKAPTLMRLICFDSKRSVLLFKVVEKKWNREAKDAQEMALEDGQKLLHLGQLREVPDTIRPAYMNASDWELKKQAISRLVKTNANSVASTKVGEQKEKSAAASAQEWLAARDYAYELIRELVTVDAIAATYAPRRSREILLQHCELKGIRLAFLRRLLHKFAWFGMNKNALLELRPTKGATGGTRLSGRKRGVRSDGEKLLGRAYSGHAVNEADLKLIESVMLTSYVKKWKNLAECYADFKLLSLTRNQFGLFETRPRNVITFHQFRTHARKLRTSLQLDKMRAHHSDREDVRESRGLSWDIAPEVGDIFDIDATEFNKELVDSFEAKGFSVNVGKATVLLVIDRRSKKIVGWHVNLKHESWHEGYRLALFCAFSDKTEHLKYLGIDAPDAFPPEENILCRAIFSDNGPAASEAGRDAYGRLGIDFHAPPPGTPEAKGDVEGSIGRAQNDQAHDAGGYRRTQKVADRLKRRLAKHLASETMYELEKKLVQFIIKSNAALLRRNLLTAEMKSAKHRVEESSNAIFTWGLRKLGAVRHRLNTAVEVFTDLLNQKPCRVTKEGVSLGGNQYNSAGLREKVVRAGGSFTTTIYYTPMRPELAYWLTDAGQMESLELRRHSKKLNGRMTFEENRHHARLLNAQRMRNAEKKRNRAPVSAEQLRKMQERLSRVHRKQRKSPTAHQNEFRAVENAKNRGARPMDADAIAREAERRAMERRAARAAQYQQSQTASPAPASASASASTAVPTPTATPTPAPAVTPRRETAPAEANSSEPVRSQTTALAPEPVTFPGAPPAVPPAVFPGSREGAVDEAPRAKGAPTEGAQVPSANPRQPSPERAVPPLPPVPAPAVPAVSAAAPGSVAERFRQQLEAMRNKSR